MATQNEEVSIDELKEEAKALGITRTHLYKDADKLQEKIDDVKAQGEERSTRKKAPKLKVSGLAGTSRNGIIRALEKEDPDSKYLTQAASLTASEAEAKGIEIVKKGNGEIMYCGEDIVCRTDRESYNAWQSDRTEKSLNAMKSIDKDLETKHGGKKIQACTEQAKIGGDPEEA